MAYKKPLPTPDNDTKEFWLACKRHELRVQRCLDCRSYFFPPLPLCPSCASSNWSWENVSGKGQIYSWFIVSQATHPDFVDEVPYTVVIIALNEQSDLRLVGRISPDPLAGIRVGMPVEVSFVDVTEDVTLPMWKPA